MSIYRALQEIYAAENKISDLSFLPESFPRLEVLNVSCNNIQNLEEVVCILHTSRSAQW